MTPAERATVKAWHQYALIGTTDTMVQAALEREYPQWMCWVVYHVVGGKVWCARRHDDMDKVPANVINVSTPTELANAIEDAIDKKSGESADE